MEYGTTFDGKSVTTPVRPFDLSDGQKIDYRNGGKFIANLKVDLERERVSFSIVDADGLEFARTDMGYEDVLTAVIGEARTLAATGARDAEHLSSYLPANYRVVGHTDFKTESDGRPAYKIVGFDNAGWTVEDYIIPRLYTGGIYVTEVQ